MDVKLYDNAATCKEGTFLDLVCVKENLSQTTTTMMTMMTDNL